MKIFFSFLGLLLLGFANKTSGQSCVADFFIKEYKGESSQSYDASALSNNNEILLVGSQTNPNRFSTDGIITKLTAQGSILWSKRFKAIGYRSLSFNDVTAMPDGGYMISGNVMTVDTITSILEKSWGLIIKIDAYGNLQWSRSFSNYNELSNFTLIRNIVHTEGNDCIVFGNIYGREGNFLARGPQVWMRVGSDGLIKWRTVISSDTGFVVKTEKFDFKLLNNATDLILGMMLSQNELVGTGYGTFWQEGYYLLNLDYNTGEKKWDKAYTFPIQPSLSGVSYHAIKNISALSNGDLAFDFSFTENASYNSAPYTKRGASMITGSNGNLKKVISYSTPGSGLKITDATDLSNDEKLLLMDDGSKPILVKTDANGDILWQYAYGNNFSGTPISLHNTSTGNFIFTQKLYESSFSFYGIGIEGESDCSRTTSSVVTGDVTNLFSEKPTDLRFKTGTEVLLPIYLLKQNFEIQTSILCEQTCCTDSLYLDDVNEIQICEGTNFVLPNNYTVKDSGMYYVSYKTISGCDSVIFYHVKVFKDPASLTINGKTCLDIADTVLLTATSGFDQYVWMNNTTTDSTLIITRPGLYTVTVTNFCGTKTVSQEVFSKCDFDIYMPTAFTPNNDGLNDIYRVPPLNKNLLESLVIYNRWGQKVFETTDINKGWDGMIKGKKQNAGTYAYVLNMISPAGRKISAKGVFTLIR